MGGLKETTINGVSEVIGGSPEWGVKLRSSVTINNPSNMELVSNTDVMMRLFYEGSVVGSIVIPNFKLKQGVNNFKALGYVKPDAKDEKAVLAARRMMSRFSGGKKATVGLMGAKTRGVPSLDPAVKSLKLVQTLNPVKEKLIKV